MPNWAWMLIIVFVALAFFEDLRRGMAADRQARLARRSHRVLVVVSGDDRLHPIDQAQLREHVRDARRNRRLGYARVLDDLHAQESPRDVAQQLALARGERLEPGSRLLN
jgi:pimeloyl-ACP methyl ester carboxylesterase